MLILGINSQLQADSISAKKLLVKPCLLAFYFLCLNDSDLQNIISTGMVQIELETEHHALQKKVEVLEQNLISEQRILQNLTDVLLLREKLEKKICEEMEVIRRNGIHSSLHDMLLKKLSEVHESSLHQQQHLKKILNKGQKKSEFGMMIITSIAHLHCQTAFKLAQST